MGLAMRRLVRRAISLNESAATLPFRAWRGMMRDFGIKGGFIGTTMREASYIGEGIVRIPFEAARWFWTGGRDSQSDGPEPQSNDLAYDARIAELEELIARLERGPGSSTLFPQPNSADGESAGSGI